jgi:hypothetical protein
MPFDYEAALASERAILAKAECDLRDGEETVRRHLASMEAQGFEGNADAERLCQMLQDVLVQWTRHRGMIQERVAYLETIVHDR